MTRVSGVWLLLVAVASLAAVTTYTRCPGCIPRDRVNDTCEWTDDHSFALDPSNPAHRAHLVEDAHLAEELGIRHADAEHGRRFGIAHHGGLMDGGRVRADCLAQMFRSVEDTHRVAPGQVHLARGVRNGAYDLVVALVFLPVYLLGATLACGWLSRRFASDERLAGLVATGLVSVAVALAGQQLFRLWGGLWEVVRVGNGHMTSIRAASQTVWAKQFAGADFIAALVVFWVVALTCRAAQAGRQSGFSATSVRS